MFAAMNQSITAQEVSTQVERLRNAMISANRAELDGLAAEILSYGHSNGNVETKAEFVENIASGKSDFVSVELTEQRISVSQDTAIVRHTFDAQTNDGGKPNTIKLKILLVWQKQNNELKLIARQAVRLVQS